MKVLLYPVSTEDKAHDHHFHNGTLQKISWPKNGDFYVLVKGSRGDQPIFTDFHNIPVPFTVIFQSVFNARVLMISINFWLAGQLLSCSRYKYLDSCYLAASVSNPPLLCSPILKPLFLYQGFNKKAQFNRDSIISLGLPSFNRFWSNKLNKKPNLLIFIFVC